MKIELSIHQDYCNDWGLYEAAREFAQNGRDAVKNGCSFDMIYERDKNLLKFVTKGTSLSHKTLLLGGSFKSNQINMLGKWGEGYKIASLALLRMNKRVRIRTGDELWEPEIIFSKKFQENVLAFNTTGNKTMRNEIVVELMGVSPVEWLDMSWKFLFLGEHNYEIEHNEYGNVLIDQKGKLFVDGLYVCNNEYFIHGYDFQPSQMPLDRDRRIVNYWEVQKLTAKIWESFYLNDKQTERINLMLAEDRGDVQHFKHTYIVTEALHQKIADDFVKRHGDVIPARTVAEIKELETYSKRGEIIASESLRSILEHKLGSVESVKLIKVDHYKITHNLSELSTEQAHNLLASQKLVNEVIGGNFPPYEIVTFCDNDKLGMRKDGRIYLSIEILNSFSETLKTIVEEVAHECGGHSSHEFSERMHEIYVNIILKQLGNNPILQNKIDNKPSKLDDIPF